VVHRVGVVIVLLCVLLSWREAEAQVGQNTEYLKDNKDFDNVGIVLSVSQLHDNFIGWDKVLPTYAGHGEGDFAITASYSQLWVTAWRSGCSPRCHWLCHVFHQRWDQAANRRSIVVCFS
jgi:hypothetical protein